MGLRVFFFQFGAVANSSARSILITGLLKYTDHTSLGQVSRKGHLDHTVLHIFNLTRQSQTVFQSGCTHLQPDPQFPNVPSAPHRWVLELNQMRQGPGRKEMSIKCSEEQQGFISENLMKRLFRGRWAGLKGPGRAVHVPGTSDHRTAVTTQADVARRPERK